MKLARPAVHVTVETTSGWVRYIVHVNNRSNHSLEGAVRSGFRKFPDAISVEATFAEAA